MTATWRALSFIGVVRFPRFWRNVLKPGIFTVGFQIDGQAVHPFAIKVADRLQP